MSYLDHCQLEAKADELSEDIIKKFNQYRVNINIKNWVVKPDRIIFRVKLKGETRESHVFARAPDVQLKLKLPLFQPFKHNYTIYIAVSERKIEYDHLLKILLSPTYTEARKKMLLPYIVGHNIMGELVIVDLASFPHLLVGGATNSGKTIGLQSLILSIISSRSPNKVNIILIDVGATNLMPFDGIPHLSYPVIRDRETALRALVVLKAEMERRIDLQITNPSEFKLLTRIVVVIDESPALLSGMGDKQLSNLLVEVISSLLQRGRRAKIHVVLAAQNPTLQNMRIDLGNITARAAFRCAKRNFSETILGERGAENLRGQGDMLFKSPQHDDLQRIQGVNVTKKELERVLHDIKSQYVGINNPYMFMIDDADLQEETNNDNNMGYRTATTRHNEDDRLFTEIVIWALERDTVSCNLICETFNIGWKRANGFLDKLSQFGIVGDVFAKLPRSILPRDIEDIDFNLIEFLIKNGVSEDEILTILKEKSDA